MKNPSPHTELLRTLFRSKYRPNVTETLHPGRFEVRPTAALPMRTWIGMSVGVVVVVGFALLFQFLTHQSAVSLTIACVSLAYLGLFTAALSIAQLRHSRAGPVLSLDLQKREALLTRYGQEPLTLTIQEVQVVAGSSRYYEAPGGRQLFHYGALLLVGVRRSDGNRIRCEAAREDGLASPLPRIGRALADAAGVPFRIDPVPRVIEGLAADEALRPA